MGWNTNVISPPKSPAHCVDGGMLEPMVMMAKHNPGSYGDIQSSSRLEKK